MNIVRKALAEFLGTAGLLIVVVGSGIMGDSLAQGNAAIVLLANSIATGCGLYVLIHMFSNFSGANFNPIVSLFRLVRRELSLQDFVIYIAAQFSGALMGVGLTHLMFGLDLIQRSTHDRGAPRFFVSEVLATFGLLMTIFFVGKNKPELASSSVATYISAAYWCTSSTSFANPAVTVARSFTDTFSGIQRNGVLGFMIAQALGCGFMLIVAKIMSSEEIPG